MPNLLDTEPTEEDDWASNLPQAEILDDEDPYKKYGLNQETSVRPDYFNNSGLGLVRAYKLNGLAEVKRFVTENNYTCQPYSEYLSTQPESVQDAQKKTYVQELDGLAYWFNTAFLNIDTIDESEFRQKLDRQMQIVTGQDFTTL